MLDYFLCISIFIYMMFGSLTFVKLHRYIINANFQLALVSTILIPCSNILFRTRTEIPVPKQVLMSRLSH